MTGPYRGGLFKGLLFLGRLFGSRVRPASRVGGFRTAVQPALNTVGTVGTDTLARPVPSTPTTAAAT